MRKCLRCGEPVNPIPVPDLRGGVNGEIVICQSCTLRTVREANGKFGYDMVVNGERIKRMVPEGTILVFDSPESSVPVV